jgi:hypothetical protein
MCLLPPSSGRYPRKLSFNTYRRGNKKSHRGIFILLHKVETALILMDKYICIQIYKQLDGSESFMWSWWICCCSCRWGETVSEMRPSTGLMFIPQIIYEYGEIRWKGIDRGKPKNSERNLSQCHFVHDKSNMDWPGCQLGPHCERPATNRLSHGKAKSDGCLVVKFPRLL